MAASPAVQLPPWKHDDLAPILFQSLSTAMDQPGLKVSLGVRRNPAPAEPGRGGRCAGRSP